MEPLSPCSQCQRMFEADRLIPYQDALVCNECKDSFFQKIQEGIDPTVHAGHELASIWIRFVARFVDGIVTTIVVYGVAIVLFLPLGLLDDFTGDYSSDTPELSGVAIFAFIFYYICALGIPCVYEAFMLGRYQATLGKMAVGIKVIRSDGNDLTFWRGFGRYWGMLLSYMICWIGFIMAFFNDEKRALHDNLADTRVVRKS